MYHKLEDVFVKKRKAGMARLDPKNEHIDDYDTVVDFFKWKIQERANSH